MSCWKVIMKEKDSFKNYDGIGRIVKGNAWVPFESKKELAEFKKKHNICLK